MVFGSAASGTMTWLCSTFPWLKGIHASAVANLLDPADKELFQACLNACAATVANAPRLACMGDCNTLYIGT